MQEAPWKRTWLVSIRMQVQSLAPLSRLMIWRCHKLHCRLQGGLDPTLLLLWCRLARVAIIRPLAWEFPYTTPATLKKAKKKKCKRNLFWVIYNIKWQNQKMQTSNRRKMIRIWFIDTLLIYKRMLYGYKNWENVIIYKMIIFCIWFYNL